MRKISILSVLGLGGLLIVQQTGMAGAAGADGFIAGTTPDRRPADAPVIQFYPHSTDWHISSLRGVSRPYPRTLSFLDNQGAWFNPFQHPGMTAPYDLRGYHRQGK